MIVVKNPSLKSDLLRNSLSKGVGQNSYGEPAWPNDILYIFPVVVLGITNILSGLVICQPYSQTEIANPFSTPIEILPEWYFFATFNILRLLPSKYLGVLSMIYLPGVLLMSSVAENITKFQNPFRRPLMAPIFL